MTPPSPTDARLGRLPVAARSVFVAALEATAHRPPLPERDQAMHERGLYYDALVAAGFERLALRKLPNGGWESWSARSIPLAKDLTAEQRAAAEIFADVSGVHIDNLGIYSAAWVRRQWLGIDPPGALFREQTFVIEGGGAQVLPAFHGLRELWRADETRAAAFIEAMPIAERLDLLADLSLARLDYWEMRVGGMLSTVQKELGDEGRAWAPLFADRLLELFRDPHDAVERGNQQRIPQDLAATVLIALTRARLPIEARWDPFFAMWGSFPQRDMEEIAVTLDEPRREAALRALVDGVAFRGERITWALDLLTRHPLPSLVQSILVDLAEAERPRDVMKALAAIGNAHPAIGSMLRAHKANTKPIPLLRLADHEEPRSADALDDRGRAQLEEANLRYGGRALSARQIFEGAEDTEEQILPGFLERWRVLSGAKHLFDAWLYMSDSGAVFRQGTTEVVAEIIQGGVESDEPTLKQALSQAIATRAKVPPKRAAKKASTRKKQT